MPRDWRVVDTRLDARGMVHVTVRTDAGDTFGLTLHRNHSDDDGIRLAFEGLRAELARLAARGRRSS